MLIPNPSTDKNRAGLAYTRVNKFNLYSMHKYTSRNECVSVYNQLKRKHTFLDNANMIFHTIIPSERHRRMAFHCRFNGFRAKRKNMRV